MPVVWSTLVPIRCAVQMESPRLSWMALTMPVSVSMQCIVRVMFTCILSTVGVCV